MIRIRHLIGLLRHLQYGPQVSRAYARNQSLVWSHDTDLQDVTQSSISDVETYLSVVRGVLHGEYKQNFRACAEYQKILEHVSFGLARQYLQRIESREPLEKLISSELALKFMDIGSPPIFPFHTSAGKKELNPTFIRYAHVAKDLEERFGPLDDLVMGEIGVGFGGQAALFNEVNGLKKVFLFDLPEVNELAKWFLSQTSPTLSISTVDGRSPLSTEVDIVISNFAFSELKREIQESYLNKVIRRSKRGYMLWNRLSETHLDGMTAESFVREIPKAQLEPEVPMSSEGNVLITWNQT